MHNCPDHTHVGNKKAGRLKKRPEFLCVSAQGRKWVSDTVVVQAMIRQDEAPPRYGFTATKKIGNAVIRNRAKRRLRAAINDVRKHYSIKSADIVLIARDVTPACPWDDLIKNITWCMKRLDLIIDSDQ